MDLNYLDENNTLKPVVMGCYGIGLGRIMASVVEQKNDEHGIIWPVNIAPFKVSIVLIDKEDDLQKPIANALYNNLMNKEIDTILDDRDLRAGVKFNDMDLIGVPYRITVGKKAKDNLVELKIRETNQMFDVHVNDIVTKIIELMK